MQMVEKKQKKLGRKLISFENEELEKLKHFAGLGLNQAELASVMGISESTLRRRKKDSELFERYMREGRTKALTDVANALYVNATVENNVQAQQFFLRNRKPEEWNKDQKVQVEHTVDLKNVIDNARERLHNDQEHIIEAKTVDIKSVTEQQAKTQQGINPQIKENKDKK
tara:strand:+ start:386 stop:895 length:510 start_codon:yes stop_codon:yes gene_type:complete